MAPTLSAAIYRELLHDLLAGDPAPGDALPSERLLSERFGVNRHAVREAVKRLQQAGLVRVSQGGATRVLDWRESGGLALMEDLVDSCTDSPQVLVAALEMRLCVGADAARRCAERAPAELLADIAAALEGRGDDETQTSEFHADAYERLWRLIVIGSGNVAYRLALNSLVAGDAGAQLRALTLPEARDVDAQRELVDAIAAGAAERAGEIAASLLGRTLGLARLADGLTMSPEALVAARPPETAPDG